MLPFGDDDVGNAIHNGSLDKTRIALRSCVPGRTEKPTACWQKQASPCRPLPEGLERLAGREAPAFHHTLSSTPLHPGSADAAAKLLSQEESWGASRHPRSVYTPALPATVTHSPRRVCRVRETDWNPRVLFRSPDSRPHPKACAGAEENNGDDLGPTACRPSL